MAHDHWLPPYFHSGICLFYIRRCFECTSCAHPQGSSWEDLQQQQQIHYTMKSCTCGGPQGSSVLQPLLHMCSWTCDVCNLSWGSISTTNRVMGVTLRGNFPQDTRRQQSLLREGNEEVGAAGDPTHPWQLICWDTWSFPRPDGMATAPQRQTPPPLSPGVLLRGPPL